MTLFTFEIKNQFSEVLSDQWHYTMTFRPVELPSLKPAAREYESWEALTEELVALVRFSPEFLFRAWVDLADDGAFTFVDSISTDSAERLGWVVSRQSIQ